MLQTTHVFNDISPPSQIGGIHIYAIHASQEEGALAEEMEGECHFPSARVSDRRNFHETLLMHVIFMLL